VWGARSLASGRYRPASGSVLACLRLASPRLAPSRHRRTPQVRAQSGQQPSVSPSCGRSPLGPGGSPGLCPSPGTCCRARGYKLGTPAPGSPPRCSSAACDSPGRRSRTLDRTRSTRSRRSRPDPRQSSPGEADLDSRRREWKARCVTLLSFRLATSTARPLSRSGRALPLGYRIGYLPRSPSTRLRRGLRTCILRGIEAHHATRGLPPPLAWGRYKGDSGGH